MNESDVSNDEREQYVLSNLSSKIQESNNNYLGTHSPWTE